MTRCLLCAACFLPFSLQDHVHTRISQDFRGPPRGRGLSSDAIMRSARPDGAGPRQRREFARPWPTMRGLPRENGRADLFRDGTATAVCWKGRRGAGGCALHQRRGASPNAWVMSRPGEAGQGASRRRRSPCRGMQFHKQKKQANSITVRTGKVLGGTESCLGGLESCSGVPSRRVHSHEASAWEVLMGTGDDGGPWRARGNGKASRSAGKPSPASCRARQRPKRGWGERRRKPGRGGDLVSAVGSPHGRPAGRLVGRSVSRLTFGAGV